MHEVTFIESVILVAIFDVVTFTIIRVPLKFKFCHVTSLWFKA